ncbi:MAG: RNA polymerase sigma factor [Bacteroidota bacterium]|nr:RNA polymerase sigma factor [Bacteroidota bacterium]
MSSGVQGDTEIIDLYGSDREKAFRLLVVHYSPRLYSSIRKIITGHENADDVLQNVWVKVWLNFSKFKGESKLYTWLYRITVNECLTFLESSKKHVTINIDHAANTAGSTSHTNGDEIQKKLAIAIDTLPPRQKVVFSMRYYDETPYEEMSLILGITIGALKASYHHAAKKIEAFLLGSN